MRNAQLEETYNNHLVQLPDHLRGDSLHFMGDVLILYAWFCLGFFHREHLIGLLKSLKHAMQVF